MIGVGIIITLAIAIFLPYLSTKGKGWRGLWFGLAIAALVVSVMFGSGVLTTAEITMKMQPEVPLESARSVANFMNSTELVLLLLAVAAFVGCLIAGCIHREPKNQKNLPAAPNHEFIPDFKPDRESAPKEFGLKECHDCAEFVKSESEVCSYCGAKIPVEVAIASED